MHTESTLALLESLTTEFGILMQDFQELTCSSFETMELPREMAARNRREAKSTGTSQSTLGQAPIAVQSAAESTASATADLGHSGRC